MYLVYSEEVLLLVMLEEIVAGRFTCQKWTLYYRKITRTGRQRGLIAEQQ